MKILQYAFSIVCLLILLIVVVNRAAAADVTVTVDGKVVDVQGVTIAITTVPTTPVPPTPVPPTPVPPVPEPPTPEPPSNCGAIPPNGRHFNWEDKLMFDAVFPGPISRQKVVSIPKGVGGYVAVKFRTGNFFDSGGAWNFEAAATPGSREIAISKCPGRFNVNSVCKRSVATYKKAIAWSTQNWSDPRYCYLEHNTTYYLNARFPGGCTSTYCDTTLRANNPDYPR